MCFHISSLIPRSHPIVFHVRVIQYIQHCGIGVSGGRGPCDDMHYYPIAVRIIHRTETETPKGEGEDLHQESQNTLLQM